MSRVKFFEIGIEDPERAHKFFTKVFGWKIERSVGLRDYWLINTGSEDDPGINGGMFKRPGPANVMFVVNVPSIDDCAANISANGGKVIVPKMALPGIGYVAYCVDPEGNTFGIMQEDRSAFLVCEVPPRQY